MSDSQNIENKGERNFTIHRPIFMSIKTVRNSNQLKTNSVENTPASKEGVNENNEESKNSPQSDKIEENKDEPQNYLELITEHHR